MNDKIIVEKVNEVFIKLKCDMSQTLEIRQYFTCYAPNFQFHPKFRAKIWDGKLCFYDYRTNTLPIGLLPKLAKFAKQFDYELDFQFDLSKMSNNISIDDLSDYLDKVFKDIDITPRDYQLDAIHKSLTNKRGIVLSPTGSGKSLIIYSMIRFLLGMNKKTMLVVPNISLVEQMYSDFKSYGWDNIDNHVTKLYNGVKPDFNKEILITTWQSIYKKQELFFKDYEALVIDECLDPSTLIKMKDGYKRIDEIENGDLVYTLNEITNCIELQPVKEVFQNMINSSNEEMYELEMEDGSTIKITGNHKVKTQRGWVEVKELNLSDEIVSFKELRI